MARPKTETSQETYDLIFKDIASSSLSLKVICKKHDIPYNAFYNAITTDDGLINQYTRAKDMQADYLADEMLSIADDATNDFMEYKAEEEGKEDYEKLNSEHINRSRLRIDTRKWIASKLKPKKYGDKIEHSGSLGVVTKIETIVVDSAKDAENIAKS